MELTFTDPIRHIVINCIFFHKKTKTKTNLFSEKVIAATLAQDIRTFILGCCSLGKQHFLFLLEAFYERKNYFCSHSRIWICSLGLHESFKIIHSRKFLSRNFLKSFKRESLFPQNAKYKKIALG